MSSVSVFVPCYNYGRFLEASVRSALDQPGVDVRVLVLDDTSTDETPAVAERLSADRRVSYVRHRTNQGHIATYNEGIEWADGDYVVLLSADDLLAPGALRRATDLLDAHPSVAFAYGDVIRFRSGDPLPPARTGQGRRSWRVWPGEAWIERSCRTGRNFVAASGVAVRTDVHKEAGGYRPGLPRTGDRELWLRLAAHGDVGRLRSCDQAYHRRHEDNMTGSQLTSGLDRFAQRRAAFDAFFDSCSERLDEPDQLRRLAAASLARWAVRTVCQALDEGRSDVDGSSVPAMLEQAAATWPYGRLPEAGALGWRLRLGPERCRRIGPLVTTAARPRSWARTRLGGERVP